MTSIQLKIISLNKLPNRMFQDCKYRALILFNSILTNLDLLHLRLLPCLFQHLSNFIVLFLNNVSLL
jgi:hypothetical protein